MKTDDIEREMPEFAPIEKALKNLPGEPPVFSEAWFEQEPRVIAFRPRFRRLKQGLLAATVLFAVGIGYLSYYRSRIPSPGAGEPENRIVLVLMVHGKVSLDRKGNRFPVTSGSTLRQDDRILTEQDGQADLMLPDRSLVRLHGEGALRLTEVGSKIHILQEKGETYHDVMPSKVRQEYRVETPTAIAGVRGTRFQVRISGHSTEVIVSQGRVLMGPPDNQTGAFKPVELQAGESGGLEAGATEIDKKNAKSAPDVVIFNEMEKSRQMISQDLLNLVTTMKDTAEQAEIEKIYNRPLETLVMSDGRVLKGVVASQIAGKLILHTTEGVVVVPVEDLVEIRYQK